MDLSGDLADIGTEDWSPAAETLTRYRFAGKAVYLRYFTGNAPATTVVAAISSGANIDRIVRVVGWINGGGTVRSFPLDGHSIIGGITERFWVERDAANEVAVGATGSFYALRAFALTVFYTKN